MKETTNYKLKMPEAGDVLSAMPLNENAQKIDTLLHSLVGTAAKVACGKYTGNGGRSVTIQTPGIKPMAMFVRLPQISVEQAMVWEKNEIFIRNLFEEPGFATWFGNDLETQYWYRNGSKYNEELQTTVPVYSPAKTEIVFTAQHGSLSWKMNATPATEIDHSFLVNNKRDTVYEWIALGTGEME